MFTNKETELVFLITIYPEALMFYKEEEKKKASHLTGLTKISAELIFSLRQSPANKATLTITAESHQVKALCGCRNQNGHIISGSFNTDLTIYFLLQSFFLFSFPSYH